MKFTVVAVAAAAFGYVAATPIDSELLTSAKAVWKRNGPIANALHKRGLEERQNEPVTDADILNFALQLEYLEGNFYSLAATGKPLDSSLTGGTGSSGSVQGGSKVPFSSSVIRGYAEELNQDETNHVKALRAALGNQAVAQPAINLDTSFTAAAVAAGIIKQGQTFSPYTSDVNFLLGSFLFEDVGVTAYNGAAPLLSSKQYLAAAASILAVEAYHGAAIRSAILNANQQAITNAAKAAKAIGQLDDGKSQGLIQAGLTNIAPSDFNSLAYARTPGQVIDIVYLTGQAGATKGGFFPNGLNGRFTTAVGAGN